MRDAMRAGTVTIGGAGGDGIEAYVARPDGPGSFGGVVVIHHLPGYDEPTKEITRRLATYGYQAICPNLYSREAPGADPDDAAAIARAAGGIPDDRLVGDVEGAAAYLRGIPGSNGRIGVIGFCSGGRQAFLAACRLPLQAAVDCYGAFVVGDPPEGFPLAVTPLLDQADRLSCPLLGVFGAEDRFPSPEQTDELDRELDRLGKPHEFHTYPEAGHAFLAVNRPSYRPAAAVDAWQRIRDFFDRQLTA
ncbi:dienelactone hydrolase family protein [Plantactinospora sp. KBS50]|uniref:dienelactone hydrolase family protein n=1 Tax=Plantactinospora sp. KBS50 TaxID=2024580 RepID=UPI000BAA9D15|nr:dienelactone hydrolase family protein [Plantactinospora sp. KBS50]ASW55166.1 carboxymethylenebutenolidase [Plantactinospora sp. KBS50]